MNGPIKLQLEWTGLNMDRGSYPLQWLGHPLVVFQLHRIILGKSKGVDGRKQAGVSLLKTDPQKVQLYSQREPLLKQRIPSLL